jgi:hypothetical protein
MNTRTLAAGTTLAATLQLMPLNAYADKVWLESDRTIVKQFAVTPSYPNKESCLLLTDNDGVIATFGFSLLQIIPLSPFSYADKAAQWSNNELIQLQVDGNKPIINQARIPRSLRPADNPKLPSGRTNVARAHTDRHHAGRCTNFLDTN